ncbi:hypothetical protein TNCV_3997741 [Trichonephila clavipes]|nr:hypothetical protein TNCV_3997741 [Trichonephila clavipes]
MWPFCIRCCPMGCEPVITSKGLCIPRHIGRSTVALASTFSSDLSLVENIWSWVAERLDHRCSPARTIKMQHRLETG